jgi:hypothetical protein
MSPHSFSLPYLAAIYLFSLVVVTVIGAPTESKMENITITLPEGTTQHGNPELLCTPADGSDIVYFFFVNYATHALTTVVLPGEGWESYLTNALASLLFPSFGAYRGLRAIFVGYSTVRKWFKRERYEVHVDIDETKKDSKRRASQARDLQKARRAGALCMVVRNGDWRPKDGDVIEENILLVGGSEAAPLLRGSVDKSKKINVSEREVGANSADDDRAPFISRAVSDIEMRSVSHSRGSL